MATNPTIIVVPAALTKAKARGPSSQLGDPCLQAARRHLHNQSNRNRTHNHIRQQTALLFLSNLTRNSRRLFSLRRHLHLALPTRPNRQTHTRSHRLVFPRLQQQQQQQARGYVRDRGSNRTMRLQQQQQASSEGVTRSRPNPRGRLNFRRPPPRRPGRLQGFPGTKAALKWTSCAISRTFSWAHSARSMSSCPSRTKRSL